jgi:TolB-like protein/tRNA A-37 threonylcarbamoyl transferase component Bud32
MIDKTISHYRIIEKLGEGGMGEVYKAEDTKLRRTVALKFLSRQALGSQDDKARFIHEAQAAAALNHPNICTIHEIDEVEGQSFIAMEFVEGDSLKDIIESGPLKLEKARSISMQIAEGLNEAHRRQIVHRDIKPANVILTGDGRVKIMDFGLAKSPATMQNTREGTTLGTTAYMSPEQGKGEAVDSRTDIWSLGVMIYEMLTGQRPFRGDYEQAVIYSISNEDPEPVTAVRTGVPVEFESIAAKCMEKDPGERYQTAADLIADLRRLERKTGKTQISEKRSEKPAPGRMRWLPWLALIVLLAVLAVKYVPGYFETSERAVDGHPAGDLKMLAVLPFENLGTPGDEYFADGITDAITARLAGISGLGVISRQSAMLYKEGGKSIREIGAELGVEYILEGTIQRERPSDPGSRVRIIPQLIHCDDDVHLWADTYDEDMTEVFRLQSMIAERVARELDVALLEPERRALAAKPTENLEAYELYFRGIEYHDKGLDMVSLQNAILMFERAVELDRDFALAWAWLSRSNSLLHFLVGEKDALADARTAADMAIRLDPDLVEAQLALGYIYYQGDLDYERALEHFMKVQKQRPGDADVNSAIGLIKRRQGRWEESLQYFKSSLKLNPRSLLANLDYMGNTYIQLRRYDEAEKYIDRALALAPGAPTVFYAKAQIAIFRDGDVDRANSFIQSAKDHTAPGKRCPAMAYSEPSIFRIAGQTGNEDGSLSCIPSNALDTAVVVLYRAESNVRAGDIQGAVALLDSARVILERSLDGGGQFAGMNYSALGFVYAFLGRKEDAIRAGKRGVEIVPISKDAMLGPSMVHRLAEIYAIVGEHEAAIDQLEIIVAIPSRISEHALRLDPMWDPLRDNPRFQQLLDKYFSSSS